MPCRETGGAFFWVKMLKRLLQLGAFLALTAWCVPVLAADEVFTTWTETDPNNRLSQTSARSTFAGVQRDETAYLSNDFGVDFFDKDDDLVFNFHTQITSTAASAAIGLAGLSNDLDDMDGLITNGKDWIGVYYIDIAGTMTFRVAEITGIGISNTSSTASYSTSTTYYFTLYRKMTGEFGAGKLILYIFSDSGRTALIEKIEHTLTLRESFRYAFTAHSRNNSTTPAVSGWVDSLDLAATLPDMSQGLTLLTTYAAAQGPPFQQHLTYDGAVFAAYAYTGNGTTTEATQIAYANGFDMVFGAEHAAPSQPVGKRGYYSSVAARFKQTWLAAVMLTSDTAANVSTQEAQMIVRNDGSVDASSKVGGGSTGVTRVQWPSVTIDGTDNAVIAGRDEGTNTQVIYQRAAGNHNRFDDAVDGWETKVVLKSGLTAGRGIVQTITYENGDLGHIIGENRSGANLTYIHSTYTASTDTFSEETEQSIATDLAWESGFRAMPMRNNKLLVVWKQDQATAGDYKTIRYRVRTAGSAGTFGTAADAVTNDVNGAADSDFYFNATSNYGKSEEAVMFYDDGTNMVSTVWGGTSWTSKSTLVSSPTVSSGWLGAPVTSVGKTGISWVDATAGGIQVKSYDLTTTQESSDGTLVSTNGASVQATDDFNTQMVTDPGGSGMSLIVWTGMDFRLWGRLRDLSTGSWVGSEAPVAHQFYNDLHNTGRNDIGSDRKPLISYGGRQPAAPVIKQATDTINNLTEIRDFIDISPTQLYDGDAGHRGYKFTYSDRLGVVYSFYLYIRNSTTPIQHRIGVIERRGGSWSSETLLMQFDDPDTPSTSNRPYIHSLTGGNESATWTITDVTDDGATASITVDDATDLVNGKVLQITGTGTALDDTAGAISALSGTTFTYPIDPAGSSSTGTATEQDTVHLIWGWSNKTYQETIAQGSVLQNEYNYMKIVPQGDETFKVYEVDGTSVTLPASLTNKDNLYEFNSTASQKTITDVSSHATTPVFTTSAAHGFSASDTVWIEGVTGEAPDDITDGKYTIATTPSSTTFTVSGTIDTSTTGASNGTVSPNWEFARLGGSIYMADDGGTIRPVVAVPFMDSETPYDATRITAFEWDGSAWNSVDVDTTNLTERISMDLVEDGAGDLVLVTENDYSGDDEIVRFKSSDHGTTWGAIERLTTSNFDNLTPLISPGYNGNSNLLWHQSVSKLHSEVLVDTIAKEAVPGIPRWWLASMDEHRLDEIERRKYIPLPEHEMEFVR